jgi:hypothetical protein
MRPCLIDRLGACFERPPPPQATPWICVGGGLEHPPPLFQSKSKSNPFSSSSSSSSSSSLPSLTPHPTHHAPQAVPCACCAHVRCLGGPEGKRRAGAGREQAAAWEWRRRGWGLPSDPPGPGRVERGPTGACVRACVRACHWRLVTCLLDCLGGWSIAWLGEGSGSAVRWIDLDSIDRMLLLRC